MLEYNVKIGLIPIRRDVTPRPGIFNWEKAQERCAAAVAYLKKHFANDQVSFADLEGINPEHVLFHEKDVDAVVERMKQEKVDAIFLINGNFGNEEAAVMVARELGKPVLLWGPKDDVFKADGTRYTDSQCGLFGMSRQLQRMNIPFSYIENCLIEDKVFMDGFRTFASVVCMVKNFRGMRLAQVGMRPKPFCSVIFNEGELMQKFGITVVPVNMAVVIEKYNRILEGHDEELTEGARLLESRYEMDDLTAPLLKKVYAFVLLFQEIVQEYRVDAVSAECWTAMQLGVGAMPCTAYSILADMGYVISCESDLHGAITMSMLACASMGKQVPFFGEFTVRHPTDRNTELLWHCGPFAYSLKKKGVPVKLVNMRQWFEVKDGTFTVARMDQDNGDYKFLAGVCESAKGPYTFGTYLWARFDHLSKWEQKLIEGPYIHHMAEIEGDYRRVIKEFCRYIPNLQWDTVE